MVYLWQINAKHLLATKRLLRRPSRTSTQNIQPYTSHIHLNILSISMNHSSTSHQYPWKSRNKTKIGRFGWLNFCNGWNSRGISWDLIGFNHQKPIKNHQKPSSSFAFKKLKKKPSRSSRLRTSTIPRASRTMRRFPSKYLGWNLPSVGFDWLRIVNIWLVYGLWWWLIYG